MGGLTGVGTPRVLAKPARWLPCGYSPLPLRATGGSARHATRWDTVCGWHHYFGSGLALMGVLHIFLLAHCTNHGGEGNERHLGEYNLDLLYDSYFDQRASKLQMFLRN